MRRHLKLSDHKHSGSHRPHEHTSYLVLLFMLAIVGVSLAFFTATAMMRPGPASGSIGLSGVVEGEPPTEGAVILVPSTGTRFSETPITVSGTCPANILVEIFKNDIFAGSTICTAEGEFSLETDLLVGRNDLTARVFDALSQEGPVSDVVTVFYDVLPTQPSSLSPLSFGGQQLIINTDAVFRGAFPNSDMQVPIDIIGGRPPFAVNVQWGDSTNKVVSRTNNETFRVSHAYARAGTYSITIQATDADNRVAFLTVAAIINGQPFAAATEEQPPMSIIQRLLVLWPLYAILVTMVISFWLGEIREKRVLTRQGLLQPNP